MPSLRLTKKPSSFVGLDIEAGSIAATEISGNGSIAGTVIAPLDAGIVSEGEVQDPVALAAALKLVFSKAKLSKSVRVGLANQSVVTRTLQLPLIEKEDEIEAAVRFQAHDEIPMPLDQAVLDFRVVNRSATGEGGERRMDVITVAARKDMLSVLIGALRDAGLRPEGIDLSAFGLIRALRSGVVSLPGQEHELPPTVLYCHLADVTNLAVAKGDNCLFTRISSVGIESMVDALASAGSMPADDARERLMDEGVEDAGQTGASPLPYNPGTAGDTDEIAAAEPDRGAVATAPAPGADLSPVERYALDEGAANLVDEVRRSLDYYAAQPGAQPVEQVVVCGPGSMMAGLPDRIQAALGRPVEIRTPVALSEFDQEDAARLTISYGLALEA